MLVYFCFLRKYEFSGRDLGKGEFSSLRRVLFSLLVGFGTILCRDMSFNRKMLKFGH